MPENSKQTIITMSLWFRDKIGKSILLYKRRKPEKVYHNRFQDRLRPRDYWLLELD